MPSPAARGAPGPWKRAGAELVIDVARKGEEATPAGLAAAELLIANSLDLDRQRLLESIRADARRPKREGRGSHYARDTILLTTSELKDLAAAVDGLLAPYRRANRGDLPEGTSAYAASFILAQDPDPA
ncbi:MAG: hypothetical protein U0S36_07695 [Candidatus Nanopelagicales bacterium]